MSCLFWSYWILSRADAVDEVAHMVIGEFEANGVVGQGSFNNVVLAGVKIGSVHPDPAVFAFERHPISLAFLFDHATVIVFDPKLRKVVSDFQRDALIIRAGCIEGSEPKIEDIRVQEGSQEILRFGPDF